MLHNLHKKQAFAAPSFEEKTSEAPATSNVRVSPDVPGLGLDLA